MIIGTFTKNEHDGFHGSVNTTGLNLEGVVFEKQEKGAAFALSASHDGQCFEIGAAWNKTGEYGDYLSVKIDGPTFGEPINATMKLKASETGIYALRWNRPKDQGEAA